MSWTVPFCSCSRLSPRSASLRPASSPPPQVAGFRFAVLRVPPPCTVAATASLRSGLQHACILSARFRFAVLGPLSLSPPAFFSHKHHFAPAAGIRAIIQPAPPIVSTGNYAGSFSLDAVERRHSACLSYCASRPASAESASCPTWLSSRPHPFSCFAATAAGEGFRLPFVG